MLKKVSNHPRDAPLLKKEYRVVRRSLSLCVKDKSDRLFFVCQKIGGV